MKLTTNIRSAFVRAIMDDVPTVDYQEQAMAMLTADAVGVLPAKARAVYDDPALNHYIAKRQVYGVHQYLYVPGPDYTMPAKVREKVTALTAQHDEQAARRVELRNKINACALACSTRKQLVEMLPEFEKYLPEDAAAASRALPVVANVVSDFVKAGWPKDKPAPATTPAKRSRPAKSK